MSDSPSAPRPFLVPGILLVAGLAWIAGRFTPHTSHLVGNLAVGAGHVALLAAAAVAVWGVAHQRPRWPLILGTAVCACVKLVTVTAIVWHITHPTGFGPAGLADWMAVGLANAGSGLWMLALIRSTRHSSIPSPVTA